MFIYVPLEITPRQQRAIAELLGVPSVDRDQVRSFLQRSAEQTLEALTLPLVASVAPSPTARRTSVGA